MLALVFGQRDVFKVRSQAKESSLGCDTNWCIPTSHTQTKIEANMLTQTKSMHELVSKVFKEEEW